AELERAVVAAYRNEQLLANARVNVTTVEARNRTFSILGEVGMPGQYQILDSDFRLFDALTLARGVKTNSGARVVRKTDDPTNPRVIEIPGEAIKQFDLKYNVVIRPG